MVDMSLSPIFFFREKEKHGEFSQWFECKFTENEQVYTSAEQYMMAQKAVLFNDKKIFDEIMKTANQAKIKKLGRAVVNFDEKTWDTKKYEIVVRGNTLKFTQNKNLKTMLLATGTALIAEASPYDNIWGLGVAKAMAIKMYENGANLPGQNLLGKALMEVRKNLQREAKE